MFVEYFPVLRVTYQIYFVIVMVNQAEFKIDIKLNSPNCIWQVILLW